MNTCSKFFLLFTESITNCVMTFLFIFNLQADNMFIKQKNNENLIQHRAGIVAKKTTALKFIVTHTSNTNFGDNQDDLVPSLSPIINGVRTPFISLK